MIRYTKLRAVSGGASDAKSATKERLIGTVIRTERETSLMGEYRSHLIADVVTGKLDAREMAATLPEVNPWGGEVHLDDTVDANVDSILHRRNNIPPSKVR